MTPQEDTDSFKKDNKITLGVIEYINKYLKNLGEVYIIPYVNCHTIYLKEFRLKNSNLILLPKGCGKTTFLEALKKGNKKKMNVLPDKMYESMLSDEKEEYFNNKIMLHYDLINAMGGLDKKQREQLTGFWSGLLSDGKFHRQNKKELKNINCLTMFGMAKENFERHRRDFFESTFLDRLVLVHRDISREEKKEILEYRRKRRNTSDFKIKMITPKYKKIILDDEEILKEIDKLSLELDDFEVVGFTRAQDYITKFLKANSMINGREIVNKNDLFMYKKIHKYHIDNKDISKLKRVIHLIKENPRITIKEIEEITKWKRYSASKYLKMARNGTKS